MARSLIVGLAAAGILAVVAGVVLYWATSGWDGDDAARAEIVATKDAPARVPPNVLKVLTWNVGFGGGLGAPTDVHAAPDVRANLDAIAGRVRDSDPDIVFLQEVDRPSRRSGDIDQFEYLRQATGFPYGCFVTTWKVNHLPFPFWPPARQVGRIHSGQAILSRFPIESCVRQPMPQPAEWSALYNRAYLHRSLQRARVRLAPDAFVDLFNVHLEAFSQGNREAQAAILADAMKAVPAGTPVIAAGDFNAVPPNALRKNGFPDEAIDFTTDRTIEIARAGTGLKEVFLDDSPDTPEDGSLTFPADAPTRRLDYVFWRGFAGSTQRGVQPGTASDHRPVEAALARVAP